MIGTSELNASEEAKSKAAKILAKGDNIPEEDALFAINNTRMTTHGDNLQFFGLDPNYKGLTGEQLYTKMTSVYQKLGYAGKGVPNWRLISNPVLLQSFTKATDANQKAEDSKDFSAPTESDKTAEASSSKAVSISFRTGEYQLDDNTKYIIDKEFAELAKVFDNARIRIEGNTDNVGNPQTNKTLSYKRAQAVADYLRTQYNMPENRFIIVGNGSDKPVADNSTDAGKAKNRRTDFQFINE
jgi:NitT/TauT family transport system substrate-binding protein